MSQKTAKILCGKACAIKKIGYGYGYMDIWLYHYFISFHMLFCHTFGN